MNREQRRRARREGETRKMIEVRGWAAHRSDDCEVAQTVHELVKAIDTSWAVDPEACQKCGNPTVVLHAEKRVWACLGCGSHGELTTMPGPVFAATTTDGEILH